MADVRLIDANALPVHWGFIPYDTGMFQGKFVFVEDVDNAPTIDAVPVVRCRDCKHHRNVTCPMRYMSLMAGGRLALVDNSYDNGFCHKGEKMDGGAEDG